MLGRSGEFPVASELKVTTPRQTKKAIVFMFKPMQ
jgi:hypothetical protein